MERTIPIQREAQIKLLKQAVKDTREAASVFHQDMLKAREKMNECMEMADDYQSKLDAIVGKNLAETSDPT